MIEINSNWEERLAEITKVWDFKSELNLTLSLQENQKYVTILQKLTADEQLRLEIKLRLIQVAAVQMAKEMLKGTIKYSTDKWSNDDWEKQFTEEFAGLFNYRLLMSNQEKLI
jgi:hypothetical protein